MIRKDGDYKIYIIQFKSKDKDWCNAGDCDQFIPGGLSRTEWEKIVYRPPFKTLHASGECWQETGVHGSFNFDDAQAAMIKVAQWNPGREFRVAQLNIKQETIQLSTVMF